ncbi:hypothetical protein BPA01_46560 [Brevibacillus parabrevis]|uniref:Uncharacterized protein n=1 Tax=Brevibacillus parabrevis TaxID=54914 RepID=A0A4Y3PSX8_BREPA|nr:hypothetical protein BPA01_46560 [Brevibacillus parabrevis]
MTVADLFRGMDRSVFDKKAEGFYVWQALGAITNGPDPGKRYRDDRAIAGKSKLFADEQ